VGRAVAALLLGRRAWRLLNSRVFD
jgi:hypothetical protein